MVKYFQMIIIICVYRLLGSRHQHALSFTTCNKRLKVCSEMYDPMGRITTPLLNVIMTLITLVTNSSLSGRL
jgi:hypothetical protein